MKNSIVPADISPQGIPAIGGAVAVPALPETSWDAAAPQAEQPDQGARFRRYWAAVKRFWWLVAGLVGIGTSIGIVATQYVDPVYIAQGDLLISDLASPNGGNTTAGGFRNPPLLPPGAWVELFKSYPVIEDVVARQRLWYKPKSWQDSVALEGIRPTFQTGDGEYTYKLDTLGRYTLEEAKLGVLERGVFGDTVGRRAGFIWLPTKEGLMGRRWVGFTTTAVRPIAEDLQERLDLSLKENSNIIRPTFSWPKKWPAAMILNAWMAAYVDKAADLRLNSLRSSANRLQAQRATADTALDVASSVLKNYLTRTSTMPSEGGISTSAAMGGGSSRDVLSAQFQMAQREYENTRRDREALERLVTQRTPVSLEVIMTIPSAERFPSLTGAVKDAVDQEAKLRAMRQQGLLDSLPQVRDAATALNALRTQTIPSLIAEASRALRARELEILRGVASDSLKLTGVPAQSINEATLRRNLSVAENLFLTLDKEYQSKRLAELNSAPDVTILADAKPTARPTRNTILLLVGGGLLGSLALGVLLALLLDVLDHRFRYPEQITHELKLDVLGALPAIPAPGDADKDPEAMLQSIEAFRGLRMNLHHAFDAPPVMVTVTSPGAGDGKSMVSSNLALSFAEAGYRTLLIDGDIRRGKVHSVFSVDRRPGLLDYLAGDVEMPAIMRDVPLHTRLTVIPSGTRRHRGPELLTSARLSTLLNSVRSRYDVVLIDSAPLAAGIDAYALGAATGNMVLVMRTGLTDRRVAKAKLKLVERLPIRVIGAIVNAVPSSGLYTEYSYLYSYAPEGELEGAPVQEPAVAVLRPVDVQPS